MTLRVVLIEGKDIHNEDIGLAVDPHRGIGGPDATGNKEMCLIHDEVAMIEAAAIDRGHNERSSQRKAHLPCMVVSCKYKISFTMSQAVDVIRGMCQYNMDVLCRLHGDRC